MTTQPLSQKPTVLIYLDKEWKYKCLFDSIYSNFTASLDVKYDVQRAHTPDEAQHCLDQHQPVAILLPDPAITLRRNTALLKRIKDNVQAGSVAIFACNFSSFISPHRMDRFWKKSWDLEWKSGSYHRTDVFLNRSLLHLPMSSLPNEYSQKATFLANVASHDAVYRPSSDSFTQSLVFPPMPVKTDETPVAFARVGQGWVGYIGDVNNEQGSQLVILAMLELGAKHLGDKTAT